MIVLNILSKNKHFSVNTFIGIDKNYNLLSLYIG